jgi:hypothetical protein
MSGGLASPPESRINSPLFPQGSSATLTSGNFSPLQCVNPRDLHDSSRFFPDHVESGEEDDLTEQDIGSPVMAQSHLTASSRMSSLQPSSPPAISEYDFGPEVLKSVLKGDEINDGNTNMASIRSRESSSHPYEHDATIMVVDQSTAPSSDPQEDNLSSPVMAQSPSSSRMSFVQPSSPPCPYRVIAAEVLKPVLKDDENNDENATMTGIRSRESSSHPQEDDATTMVMDQSRAPSSEPQDDDATMVGVPSRKASPEPQDNEEGDIMVGIESNDKLGPLSDLSDLEEDNEEGPAGVDLSQYSDNGKVEGDSAIAVEAGEPMSETKASLSESSDSEEDDEEYQPVNAVESSDSNNKKFASPIVGTEEATPKAEVVSNQMLLDFESSVNIQGQFSLRRSSRFSKNNTTINYADQPAPRKSSSGRKKPALEDEYHQLASLKFFSI